MLSLDFGGGFAVDQAGSARRHRVELAGKKIKHRYQFSIEGVRELEAFHQRVLNNLKLAFSAFMSGDVRMARTLIEEKTGLRNAELAASESHLRRLRDGRAESIETIGHTRRITNGPQVFGTMTVHSLHCHLNSLTPASQGFALDPALRLLRRTAR